MRTPLIAGNWKMNTNIEDGLEIAKGLVEFSNNFNENRDILICVPFTSLYSIKEVVKDSNVKIGAQNMYFEDKGAFTGEISPLMLKDIGVDFVLIGHSERRQYFGEDNELLNKKIKSAIFHDIKPILCVGETLCQRENNMAKEVISDEIKGAFVDVSIEDMRNIAIAYEPIWAIGTGKTATSDQAQEILSFIRDLINDLYGNEISDNIRLLYGGSVKANNATDIMGKVDIDGALVGGASLKLEEFTKIISY